eukprot:1761088-Pleurochrysis_carterae.AAC.2
MGQCRTQRAVTPSTLTLRASANVRLLTSHLLAAARVSQNDMVASGTQPSCRRPPHFTSWPPFGSSSNPRPLSDTSSPSPTHLVATAPSSSKI